MEHQDDDGQPGMDDAETRALLLRNATRRSLGSLGSFVGLGPPVRRTWVIEVVTFVYAMIYFALNNGATQLVQKAVCKERAALHTNSTQSHDAFCNSGAITGPTADQLFYYQLANVIPAFFTVPYFAAVADHTGRRTGMIVACVGQLVIVSGYMLLAVLEFHLAWMYLPQVLFGLCGTLGLLLMAVFAAVADVTTDETRGARIAVLEAALILGGAAGAMGGGLLTKTFGFPTFFICLACTTLFPLAVTIGFMPETLPPQPAKKVTWREANFFASLAVFFRSWPLFFLLVALCVCLSLIFGMSSVLVLYFKHKYNWHEDTIGFFVAALTGCRGVGLAVVLPLALRWTRGVAHATYLLSQFSCVVYIANVLLWAFVPDPTLAFLFTLTNLFTAWTVPLIRVITSSLLDAREQGLLFGGVSVLEACVSPLVGVTILNKVYAHTADSLPNAVFYVACSLLAATMAAMLGYYVASGREAQLQYISMN